MQDSVHPVGAPDVVAAACGPSDPQATAPRDSHYGGHSYEASMLREMLAVIHRDGGHYLAEHGLDMAIEDAQTKVLSAFHALEELVALKDLKTRMESLAYGGFKGEFNGQLMVWEPKKHEHDRLQSEYERRKPFAWSAARAAVAQRAPEALSSGSGVSEHSEADDQSQSPIPPPSRTGRL